MAQKPKRKAWVWKTVVPPNQAVPKNLSSTKPMFEMPSQIGAMDYRDVGAKRLLVYHVKLEVKLL